MPEHGKPNAHKVTDQHPHSGTAIQLLDLEGCHRLIPPETVSLLAIPSMLSDSDWLKACKCGLGERGIGTSATSADLG